MNARYLGSAMKAVTILLIGFSVKGQVEAPDLKHEASPIVEESAGEAEGSPYYRSPRSTFTTLLEVKKEAVEGEPEALEKALGCLDLSLTPPVSRQSVGKKAYYNLIQTIDRLEEVSLEQIPDETSDKEWVYRKRTVPMEEGSVPVEITLHRNAEGNWQFTPATIDSIEYYFQFVKNRKVVKGIEEVVTYRDSLLSRFPFLGKKLLFFTVWQWVGLILVVFIAAVLERMLSRLAKRFIQKAFEKKNLKIAIPKSEVFLIPLRLLIYSGVLRFGLDWLFLPIKLINALQQASILLFTIGLVWMLLIAIDTISSYFAELAEKTENKFDDLLVPLLRKTSKLVTFFAAIIFLAESLWDNVAGILAGFGIGGLAVALAAKDTLANLFGSLTVLLDRPFQIGDWIHIDDIDGTVEEVGFRSTRVRTFYNSLITIPNNMLINTSIDNYGARRYRRFKAVLGIEYHTDPQKIEAFCEGIRQLIITQEATRKDYFHVYLNNLGNFSLEILLYVFFETPDWSAELVERHKLLVNILRLGKRMGVNFAFPTQTIHMSQADASDSLIDIPQDTYLYGKQTARDVSASPITMKHARSGIKGSDFPDDVLG
ncbi:MAG: mechanosensitive ion channel protein MscS [Acidobacteria bacterium]|nr:MAG: mechanosensitive ion channel protein MscS [Acidobacteriota bacterium]